MKLTYKKILIVCLIMGTALLLHDYLETKVNFDGTLKRNEAGSGSAKESLELEILDESRELTVEVSEQALMSEQVESQFEKAIEEINETYLGKNESANNVCYDLNLKSSYCEGLIQAYWRFDNYGIISNDGKLNEENILDEGQVVNIIAELSYEEYERVYSFFVVVTPPSFDTAEGRLFAIEKAVKKTDADTKTDDSLRLPTTVGNMNLSWKRKMNFRGLQLMLLGILAVIGIHIGEKRDSKQQALNIIAKKEQDYPLIVSELSILLSAGMSFRKALERIVTKYNQRKATGEIRAGYEDMVLTYRKMLDGMGELKALEDLGQKSDCKEYRKLAMLLVQNLKKGSKDLITSLEKEEQYAFEMRKQRAIRAGEEASTKLLLPMAGMLFIVIVILIVPALMSFSI